jgi:FAD synthase
MLVFRFGREPPRWKPRNSSPTSLVKRIGAAGVVTGDDFSFGRAARATSRS